MSRYLLLELDRIENWDIQQLLTGLFIDRSMRNSLDIAAAAAVVFSSYTETLYGPFEDKLNLDNSSVVLHLPVPLSTPVP